MLLDLLARTAFRLDFDLTSRSGVSERDSLSHSTLLLPYASHTDRLQIGALFTGMSLHAFCEHWVRGHASPPSYQLLTEDGRARACNQHIKVCVMMTTEEIADAGDSGEQDSWRQGRLTVLSTNILAIPCTIRAQPIAGANDAPTGSAVSDNLSATVNATNAYSPSTIPRSRWIANSAPA